MSEMILDKEDKSKSEFLGHMNAAQLNWISIN